MNDLSDKPASDASSGKPLKRLRGEFRRCVVGLLILAWIVVSGCAVLPPEVSRVTVPAYHPRNTFNWGAPLPTQLRRVALLPIACEEIQTEAVEGRDSLEPIVLAELMKTQKFEVVRVSQELLRSKTGRARWSSEDALPAELLDWVCQSSGCDGVFFCKLTAFRGYAPLAVGWRMRLVDAHTRTTVWAGDEVFDGGDPRVQSAARQYQRSAGQKASGCGDSWSMENSPRQFGQYAAAQMLGTLPGL